MKQIFLISLIILFSGSYAYCQSNNEKNGSFKKITPLKNNTFDIKEFTRASLLMYKGVLSSIDPEVRQGKFYFYDNKGRVIVTGSYKQDIPFGTWVYYNDSFKAIKTINYTAVWDYLETDALNYTIDSTALESLEKKDRETMNPDGTFYLAEKMPTFKGGDPNLEFNKYIKKNLIYPIYSAKQGITGQVKLQFIIDSDGKLRNPVINSPVFSDLNIEALRVLSESPVWEPGYQNDLPINVRYDWSISFPCWDAFYIDSPLLKAGTSSESENEIVYSDVDEFPSFNGRDPTTEFRKFIFQNLRYPKIAAAKRISGRVIVQFTVNSKGKVTNPVVVISADPALDEEAIRVVMSSPPWEPGRLRGKPVNVMYTFPINFILKSGNEIRNY